MTKSEYQYELKSTSAYGMMKELLHAMQIDSSNYLAMIADLVLKPVNALLKP